MQWYLTIRALTVLAFIAAVAALGGAAFMADEKRWRLVRRFLALCAALAVLGSVLISFGWSPEHP